MRSPSPAFGTRDADVGQWTLDAKPGTDPFDRHGSSILPGDTVDSSTAHCTLKSCRIFLFSVLQRMRHTNNFSQ